MKVTIIAPFYDDDSNVGNVRINRFIKWLKNKGAKVLVIGIGTEDEIRDNNGITIVYHRNKINTFLKSLLRIKHKVFRQLLFIPTKFILNFIFIPDFYMDWVKKVSKDFKTRNLIEGSNFIIASSPMESSLVLGYKLSKELGIKLITDLRDGWTIEPLNQMLKFFPLRIKIEENLERKVLNHSSVILVTSTKWKKLLMDKFENINHKIYVLTNSYPDININSIKSKENISSRLKLIYAGRFSGSSYRRTVKAILEPIFNYIENTDVSLAIEIYGEFHSRDFKELHKWEMKYKSIRSELLLHQQISRIELFNKYNSNNGFLMLSASQAAIPSKLFEYILFRKPLLVVAPLDSEVANVCGEIKQAYIVDIDSSDNSSTIETFLKHCKYPEKFETSVPSKFNEDQLEKDFLKILS